MNTMYRLKKRWYSLLQKYRLSIYLRNVRKLFAFLFFVWLTGSLLTIASQMIFAREAHTSFRDYIQYFWIVIIELVSGFDVPGDIPLHLASQLISILMLVMGLVVVGLFTGQIISMFVHVLQKMEFFPEKPDNFRFCKPIILCGCGPRIYNIIDELRRNPLSRDREIIIVDKEAHRLERKHYRQADEIWYVSGDPADRKILQKAVGRENCRVIILSKNLSDEKWSHALSLNTALAIEAFDETAHTVVEIAHTKSMAHFQRTKINDWVCVSEFGLKLISQSALQPGMANVFASMLGNEIDDHAASRIYFSPAPLPQPFVGASFTDIVAYFHTKLSDWDITLIGFAKYIEDAEKERLQLTLRNSNYFVQINPLHRKKVADTHTRYIEKSQKLYFYRDTVLESRDKLIYLASEEIDFGQIKEKQA